MRKKRGKKRRRKHNLNSKKMEAMRASVDKWLAASFDPGPTGGTQACRLGDDVWVLAGGVHSRKPVAALLFQLSKLPSPAALKASIRVVRDFVLDMERECVSIADLVAKGATFADKKWFDALQKAQLRSDNVALPPFASLRNICFGVASSRLNWLPPAGAKALCRPT